MKSGRSTDGLWRRVKSITADALERPEGEQRSFLASACAGDETLRAEVESLLGAHARAGGFLEASGLAATGAATAVALAADQAVLFTVAGRRIGPYRVLGELGRGGMGVVYLAERADAAFEKKVAIKVVRGGFAAEPLMHRFREERRILATLDHPNIARLLDAGTTEDGLPYFVMEHVDGIPLDVYCQELPSHRPRLVLFHRVCAGVQYAHQRLVIHRDLKSRNILVTADGTPKLLDFGIAKLLEPGLEAEEQTRDRPSRADPRGGEPRAGPRRAADRDQRRLFPRRAALPAAHWTGSLRIGAAERRRPHARHLRRRAGAAERYGAGRATPGAAGRAGLDHAQGPAQGARPPLRVGGAARRRHTALSGRPASPGRHPTHGATGHGNSSPGTGHPWPSARCWPSR